MTLHLPDSLAERAEAYAAAHGTTMDAILVSHLEAVVRMEARDREGATLRAYSEGRLSRAQAIRDLGLRDYASLLVLLGESDLPMPLQDPREVARQAAEFEWLPQDMRRLRMQRADVRTAMRQQGIIDGQAALRHRRTRRHDLVDPGGLRRPGDVSTNLPSDAAAHRDAVALNIALATPFASTP